MKDSAPVRGLAFPLFLLLGWLGAMALTNSPLAQERAGFTAAQAERGAVVYDQACSSCHGPDLSGTAEAPALSGAAFLAKWRPMMMIELYRVTLQTMPPQRPGSLSEADALAVDAFILQRNDAVAGAQALTAGVQTRIGSIISPATAGGPPRGDSRAMPVADPRDALREARLSALRAPLARLTPVTGAMLRDPAPDDWLMWRRTYNGWGHSPLAHWIPPSYDPELNLLFVGTGSPYPWSSEDRGTNRPNGGGTRGDSLYTSCTLAINPDTGRLVWYYAHLPNDTFDQDYAFERLIVPIDWRGRTRKAVVTAGKPAVIEVLDAATGAFLFALDPGAQNIFTFNPETGRKTLLPPGPPEGIKRCPSNDGARNYLAGSYDPVTNRYYLSVNDICTGKGGETPDRLLGLDLARREFTMDIRSSVMQTSAKLTTAGGLLFSASADRYFRAYDSSDGRVLWQTRLQDVPNAFPITYAVAGTQYVAMVVGNPGLIGNGAVNASPEYMRPEPASVLWVWQVP